jgi:hypothetical protein
MTDRRDEQWLRERLTAAVPEVPAVPSRAANARERHRRAVRRRAVITVAGAVLVVLAGALPVALTRSADDAGPVAPTSPTATSTGTAVPELTCSNSTRGGGSGTLPSGPVAIRLCGGRPMGAPPPADVLTSGTARVVAAFRGLPAPAVGCLGRPGNRYTMLVGYADGTIRRVELDMSGCGTVTLGREVFGSPDKPYDAFLDAVRAQRTTTVPPATVETPTCPRFAASISPLGEPGQIVKARLCVGYGEPGGVETSVEVPAEDLKDFLASWQADSHHPATKSSGCSPTTPNWELAGVDPWGDLVTIEAECGVPRFGNDAVVLDAAAREIVDGLVRQAGLPPAAPVLPRDVAWRTAQAYIDDINFGHRAAAASLWQGHPQLPPDGSVLDLTLAPPGCAKVTLDTWRYAWSCLYRSTSTGATTTFTMVRNEQAEIWRIWSIS